MGTDEMTSSQISAFMREMGRKGGRIGGKRRLETLSPERRSEIASLAARARWGSLDPSALPRSRAGVFPLQGRVQLSAAGRQAFGQRQSAFGVVVGYGRQPDLIRVRVNGTKDAETWHMKFWERAR